MNKVRETVSPKKFGRDREFSLFDREKGGERRRDRGRHRSLRPSAPEWWCGFGEGRWSLNGEKRNDVPVGVVCRSV